MLRVSAMTNDTNIDLQAVNGDVASEGVGVPFGPQLIRFAESIALRDVESVNQSRQELYDLAGKRVVVDAAAVAANFQRMVRIADSIGISVDDMQSEIGQLVRKELNLERFPSAQNTLGISGQ